METKTLVVDVDDTISTHRDRDYANAVPNVKLIAKLNHLKSTGWRIVYYTARGQLSCDGDLERIERERRPALVDWMRRHGVQYDELQFGKPLGVYYVDDKAVRPDEFLDMEFRTITGGSGASVEIIGSRVIKKAPNALDQARWYRRVVEGLGSEVVDVPEVYTAYGDTIEMENVGSTTLEQADDIKIFDLLRVTNPLYSIDRDCGPFWQTMVDRVAKHLDTGLVGRASAVMELINRDSVHYYMNDCRSFCHGDLTLENVVVRPNGSMCLIDPNYVEGLYSSFMLDVGKIFQSIDAGYEDVVLRGKPKSVAKHRAYAEFTKVGWSEDFNRRGFPWHVKLVELVHFVRLVKYRTKEQQALANQVISGLVDELSSVP